MITEKLNIGQDKAPVLPLGALGGGDIALAGGKGANLGELLRAGIPVPNGFVVTTAAYDTFTASNHLNKMIVPSSNNLNGSVLREAIEKASIPADIEQAILKAYGQLGQGPVAVRSSATAEDLPEAAFAGQMDSFLDIQGDTLLLEAVRRCWASLWSDRAMAYRERQRIDHSQVKIAVVVQRMVPAEIAGVLFTVNPVTGARDEITIDAHRGLGEAVVSGMSISEHYVLRRRILGWKLSSKRVRHQSLSSRNLLRLAKLGALIERHFRRPQDIEWALVGGKIFIVQARPMTAVPDRPLQPGWLQKTAAGMLAEYVPERPYPLEMTSWTPLFFDALAAMIKPLGLALPRFRNIFKIEDDVVISYRGKVNLRISPPLILAPLRVLWVYRRYDPLRWRDDPLLGGTLKLTAELAARDLPSLDWPGLLSTVRDCMSVISPFLGELRRRYALRAALAAIRLRVEMTLMGRGKRFSELISSVQTKTLETNRALEDLASLVRQDSILSRTFAANENGLRQALQALPPGRDFLAKFDAFLDCYGHRDTVSLLLFAQPTWKESPQVVLGIIKEMASGTLPARRDKLGWERARDEVLLHPLLYLRPLRNHFLRLLGEARCFTAIREDTRFYAALPLPVLRRSVLEMGRRLAAGGVIESAQDIFHLTMKELEMLDGTWPPSAALKESLSTVAAKRRKRRLELEGIPLIDPRLFRRVEQDVTALVSGSPAGRGLAEGRVRIILQPSEFNLLRPGEVLVAPYTNPSWTPLFQRAGALVVDTGGSASHAAIVAREYGLPAVMGTVDGTRRLHDGQRVRVDGTRGMVFAAEPE